jgi:hypothetical protein
MTIKIEFTPEQEAELTAQASRQGLDLTELVKRLVTENLSTGQEKSNRTLTAEDRIKAMDAIAEQNRGLPMLPEEAFDRENIYEDRL